mgnify:CR=1 FL=1
MSRPGLVKAATLEPFVRFLSGNGINLGPHFRLAGIPPVLMEQQDSWLTKQQVYRFLADVASAHKVKSLGLVVGDQICVDDFGELGTAI